MDYKYLIKIIEDKRNSLYKDYKNSLVSKRVYIKYINKYDKLLLELYTKYDKYLTIK